jgi:hypothetical protein
MSIMSLSQHKDVEDIWTLVLVVLRRIHKETKNEKADTYRHKYDHVNR